MPARLTVRRAAALMWLVCAVLAVPSAVLLVIGPGGMAPSQPDDLFSGFGGVAFLLLGLTSASVGAAVARRVPDNRIGWVLSVTGLVNCINLFTWQYVDVGLHTAHHLPGSAAALVINGVVSSPVAALFGVSVLLFPDGRLPSRRWWPVLASLLAGMVVLVLAAVLTPGPYDAPFASVSNPLGVPGTRGAFYAVEQVAWVLVVAGIVAGAASLVVRLRRARGAVRRQLKLVLAVGSCTTTVVALDMSTWFIWPHGALPARMAVIGVAFAAFFLAAGFAILRRGLYAIDVVLNRTLVYGSVTGLLAGAFAATVVVLGTALGRGSPATTAVATLVVAVAFRPVRTRTQDVVDRRFNRARYDALHRMAGFLTDLRAGHSAPEEVEALLRELLGDPTFELRFFLPESRLYVDARGLPAVDTPGDRRARVPIELAGQPLGQVLHSLGGGADDIGSATLLRELVEAGGLAIEIARLRVELRRQLVEVQDSRARLVTAADEERRRIERDLHDGAQQRFVSVGLALRHAQHALGATAPQVSRALDGAVAEITVAIDELRELARGLRPAQLDAGLGPALRELARRAPLPVEVRTSGPRAAPDVEAAAYFTACEGLTNAVKHARARKVVLDAARQNGRLVVSVTDDGVGGASPRPGSGLAGLVDRVAAQGGTLRITSAAGAGTTLTAEFPCAS